MFVILKSIVLGVTVDIMGGKYMIITLRCWFCDYTKGAIEVDKKDILSKVMALKAAYALVPAFASVKVHMGKKHKGKVFKYDVPKLEVIAQ